MAKSDNQTMNQLTRESLHLAMIALLENQPLEKITVTALTEKAGVSRMAYYRNYDSMEALFYDVLDQVFKSFLQTGQQYIVQGQWYDFWLSLFNFLYQNKSQIKIILNSEHNAQVLTYLNHAFTHSDQDINQRYSVLIIIGTAFNVLNEWIRNDFDIAPDELAKLCDQFTNPHTYPNQHPALPKKYTVD